MNPRIVAVAAVVAAAGFLSPTFVAAAKDEPTSKEGHEALRKEFTEKKYMFYHDLSHRIDPVKLKESRWEWKDPPPFKEVFELQGGQFLANWVPNTGAAPGITFVVIKFPHYVWDETGKHGQLVTFKSWGETVNTTKVDDMAKGFYEDWIKECAEFNKSKSTATRKKKFGPGEWWATAVGIDNGDGGEKKRVRKIWYTWSTTGGGGVPATWKAEATIAEKFIDTDEVIQRADDLMKFTVPEEDKRARVPPGVK